MKICPMELRKTLIGLQIIERKKLRPRERLADIMKECGELIAIFVKSVKTAEDKSKK